MKTLRNNFYIVKLFCKAAPVKVAAELAQAIDQEEYEKAAGLRDEIRALKGKGEGHDDTVE